ncbi:hypothetical protein B0O99DRAFT_601621 [Bisporella sp. PMI_857]|jgi:hypothetical protein|nr:hypothetical protein B0O99DRAFT_601621 [Bisporella sp. PMI_857]
MAFFSNLTSKVATIRQNLLASETDGDTIDDTHLCRVLRSHYTEYKKQPLPAWLPPDPRAPPPPPVVMAAPAIGSRYGATNNADFSSTVSRGRNDLSGLWEKKEQPQRPQPQSLRSGRREPLGGREQQPLGGGREPAPAPRVRGLPSQQEGSYQAASFSSSGSGKSRLLDRLGNKSPATGRASPGASSPVQQYDRRGGSGDRPVMSANSPWASNGSSGYGGGYGR